MIFGSGIDLVKCERLLKWLKAPKMLERFFNAKELIALSENSSSAQKSAALQHYAARFAAKEAFSKALGTGLAFDLRDAFIQNNENGRPSLTLENSALNLLKKQCPNWQDAAIFVSLSHEKEYAMAQVIIEIQEANPIHNSNPKILR